MTLVKLIPSCLVNEQQRNYYDGKIIMVFPLQAV